MTEVATRNAFKGNALARKLTRTQVGKTAIADDGRLPMKVEKSKLNTIPDAQVQGVI